MDGSVRVKCYPTLGILVGNDGHVMVPANGINKAHWTFGCKYRNGYLHVKINGKAYKVHRLVAQTFIPNPENLPEVDHINRDPTLNSKDNLRWTSSSGNSRNTCANDRIDTRGGTHWYEDEKQYKKEWEVRRRKTHKNVWFSDGKQRRLPNSEALELLKLPLKERVYGRKDTQQARSDRA